jgi:2-dehydro-3-deoxyphosphogluconate aldolase/(4S)-4-hydroxy-2-oxoglutarate aldolase
MPPRQEDTIMHALFHGISVIPVLTIERERDAVPLARALFEGGLPVIEITMRTAAAPAAIASIARELPQTVIGAGTLLRAADVATAVHAGAAFLVSPGMTAELPQPWRRNCPISPVWRRHPRSWRRAPSASAS